MSKEARKHQRKGQGSSESHRRSQGMSQSAAARFLWMGGAILLLGTMVYLLLAGGLLRGSGRAKGKTAPDITLSIEEGSFRLSEQRGKVVALYFSFPG